MTKRRDLTIVGSSLLAFGPRPCAIAAILNPVHARRTKISKAAVKPIASNPASAGLLHEVSASQISCDR